jgi:hypothetical protein
MTENLFPSILRQFLLTKFVVDENLAYLLGESRFKPALEVRWNWDISVFKKVGKDLYWVALITSLFFKWMNNQEGTVGYVMVSTNERDVKLVQKLAEKTSKLN